MHLFRSLPTTAPVTALPRTIPAGRDATPPPAEHPAVQLPPALPGTTALGRFTPAACPIKYPEALGD